MTEPELTCAELVELITDYLEGDLPDDGRGRVEDHLSECPPCAAVVAQFRAVVALAGRVRERDVDPIDDTTQAALVQAFREARPTGH